MEFTPDDKVRALGRLAAELFEHALHDEEPIFVGDQATILDVSLASPEELQKRCSIYYKTTVSLDDLRQPLWQLLPELDLRRRESSG
jgi:hypothetical protein